MAEEAKREEAKRIRTSAKARFTKKRNEFFKSVEENKGMEAVKRTFADLHEAWNIVEGKHDIYIIHLAEDEIEQNETWINELQELCEEERLLTRSTSMTKPCTSRNEWKKFTNKNQ